MPAFFLPPRYFAWFGHASLDPEEVVFTAYLLRLSAALANRGNQLFGRDKLIPEGVRRDDRAAAASISRCLDSRAKGLIPTFADFTMSLYMI
jgi:hypothetical protein